MNLGSINLRIPGSDGKYHSTTYDLIHQTKESISELKDFCKFVEKCIPECKCFIQEYTDNEV